MTVVIDYYLKSYTLTNCYRFRIIKVKTGDEKAGIKPHVKLLMLYFSLVFRNYKNGDIHPSNCQSLIVQIITLS